MSSTSALPCPRLWQLEHTPSNLPCPVQFWFDLPLHLPIFSSSATYRHLSKVRADPALGDAFTFLLLSFVRVQPLFVQHKMVLEHQRKQTLQRCHIDVSRQLQSFASLILTLLVLARSGLPFLDAPATSSIRHLSDVMMVFCNARFLPATAASHVFTSFLLRASAPFSASAPVTMSWHSASVKAASAE